MIKIGDDDDDDDDCMRVFVLLTWRWTEVILSPLMSYPPVFKVSVVSVLVAICSHTKHLSSLMYYPYSNVVFIFAHFLRLNFGLRGALNLKPDLHIWVMNDFISFRYQANNSTQRMNMVIVSQNLIHELTDSVWGWLRVKFDERVSGSGFTERNLLDPGDEWCLGGCFFTPVFMWWFTCPFGCFFHIMCHRCIEWCIISRK